MDFKELRAVNPIGLERFAFASAAFAFIVVLKGLFFTRRVCMGNGILRHCILLGFDIFTMLPLICYV